MSLIESIPVKWKVAAKATNDNTDYLINIGLYNCLAQKKYTRFSLKKVLIQLTAKKWIQNEFSVCKT